MLITIIISSKYYNYICVLTDELNVLKGSSCSRLSVIKRDLCVDNDAMIQKFDVI